MKRVSIALLMAFAAASFVLTACSVAPVRLTPQPTDTPATALVSIGAIERNPDAFRDKLVRMQGYGVIVATAPLCPGYVGLDRRAKFVDAERGQMTAEVKWKPAGNARMYDPDNLRVF